MFSKIVRSVASVLVACTIIACSRATPTPPPQQTARPVATDAPASSVAVAASEASVETPAPDSTPQPAHIVVYSQPPKSGGGLIMASWRAPDGSDTDRWIWENFGFENAQTLTEVRWRGGYDPAKNGSGGPVHDFTLDIYASIPSGTEPNLAIAPLVHYKVGGNAGETPADVAGDVQTYEYRFVLPVPFEVTPATTYWIQIEAFQAGAPDWGLAVGTGTLGDGRHFRASGNQMEGYYNQLIAGDVALEFLAPVLDGAAPVAEVVTSLEDIAAMMANLPPPEVVPVNAEGVQEVMLVVSRSGYTPVHFAVQAGVPVRLVFRQLGYVPGGNELNVRWGERESTYVLLASPTDKKVIEFTPQESGEFKYSCPHDWYWGVMTVQ